MLFFHCTLKSCTKNDIKCKKKYLTHEQAAPDRQGSEDGRATPLDAEEADIGVDERESGLEEV